MTASISLVLFDMEGVLSLSDRSARVDHLSAVSGQTPDVVRHAIWESGLEARADAGLITDDEYLTALGDLLGCRITRDDWLIARRASILPNAEVLALAEKVSAKRRIAVLTNNCRLVADNIEFLSPEVAALFGPHVCVSASFGAAKPAARAYLGCLEHLGAGTAETLFIDDAEANVAGAINAGLHGYRFVSADSLSEELERRQLM
ncbi:HAD family phosphatase [Paraburkholderia sp. BL10I2N1]|uniref:HAD family hydrolase n=1 Tax=Paraburkholderia sp. BL10I2N1 TaxID=1938796 RepID=UPI001061C588|nr:HAD family phosphatase [Paraburkholderia sp. BL10I2N1]TDN61540.1 putative hydrolase of the HAD superfamily [Paraburkholderia sp. BL10I2N1]